MNLVAKKDSEEYKTDPEFAKSLDADILVQASMVGRYRLNAEKEDKWGYYKPTAGELASLVSDYLNGCSSSMDSFFEQLGKDHRTLQQLFTRLCCGWFRFNAERAKSEQANWYFDPRNDDTKELSLKLESNPIYELLVENLDELQEIVDTLTKDPEIVLYVRHI